MLAYAIQFASTGSNRPTDEPLGNFPEHSPGGAEQLRRGTLDRQLERIRGYGFPYQPLWNPGPTSRADTYVHARARMRT